MGVDLTNNIYSQNTQIRPKKQAVSFAKNSSAANPIQDTVSLNTGIDAKIAEFRIKGDLEGYTNFLNSKEFPHKDQNEARVKYIAEYFDFLKQQAKIRLKSDISIEMSKEEKTKYFSTVNPKEFLRLYQTIAKYETLARIAAKDAPGKKGLGKSFIVYPRTIILVKSNGFSGRLEKYGRLKLEIGDIKRSIEHELGHLTDDSKNGPVNLGEYNQMRSYHQSYSYLNILTPAEEKLYIKFLKNYIYFMNLPTTFNDPTDNLPPRAFHLNELYDNQHAILPKLKANFELLKPFLAKHKHNYELLPPEEFSQLEGIIAKLSKFNDDVIEQISTCDYYRTSAYETKPEAFKVRAKGKPAKPDYLLPVTEELEANLARLGMPEPATYNILSESHPTHFSKHVEHFGEELRKLLAMPKTLDPATCSILEKNYFEKKAAELKEALAKSLQEPERPIQRPMHV